MALTAATAMVLGKLALKGVISIPITKGVKIVAKEAFSHAIPAGLTPVQELCVKAGTWGLAGAAGAIAANHVVSTVETTVAIAKTVVDELAKDKEEDSQEQ